MDFSKDEYANRLQRIRRQMAGNGVDALFVTGAHNVRYATGFRGEPRALLLTQDRALLTTSFRCIPWAEEQTSDIDLSTDLNPVEAIREYSAQHLDHRHRERCQP